MIPEELKEAFAYINSNAKRILNENIKICEIPSPTFYEQKRAKYLFKRIRKLGVKNVKTDKIGNVIARIHGRKPTMLLVAHMDTVFNETKIKVKRRKGWLYAPGIGDDAAGITVLIYLLELLERKLIKITNELVFAFTVKEEAIGVNAGMKFLLRHVKPDFVLNIDGKGLKQFRCTGIYSERIIIKLEVRGGHALNNFGKPNAIHIAGRIIAEMTKIKVPKRPPTSYNVDTIESRGIISALVQNCEMCIDLRSESKQQLTTLKNKIIRIAKRITKTNKARVRISTLGKIAGGTSPKKAEIVRFARKAMYVLGINCKERASTTDGNISIAARIPTITISSHEGKFLFGHSLNEKLFISSLPKGVKLAVAILKNFTSRLMKIRQNPHKCNTSDFPINPKQSHCLLKDT